ncbi:MAG: metallophosphoesterase [Oscillospiraceae bacterium]|nr:metallophosphoesterase [Oscillospiraceae bacterium]
MMTLTLYILWFLLTAAWIAALTAAQVPLRKRRLVPVRIILAVVKILLGMLAANLVMIQDIGYHFWVCYVLTACHIALYGDALGDLLILPFVIAGKRESYALPQGILCTALAVSYLVFGTVNMQLVTAERLTFRSEKLTEGKRIVFVSDLHVGSSQSLATTDKTIRMIAEEEPDLVLLGGDIVDEYTTKEEMNWVFSQFGALDAPVYYIYGNHDRQDRNELTGGALYTPEELETALQDSGLRVLRDEWIRFSEDLVILGREDVSRPERLPLAEIPARPEDAFVLLVDHAPYQTEEIEQSGADLQLSGHSHAAQLFPLLVLYDLTGYEAYGTYLHGATTLYVSPGASGWCMTFRSEKRCSYAVISLMPEMD